MKLRRNLCLLLCLICSSLVANSQVPVLKKAELSCYSGQQVSKNWYREYEEKESGRPFYYKESEADTSSWFLGELDKLRQVGCGTFSACRSLISIYSKEGRDYTTAMVTSSCSTVEDCEESDITVNQPGGIEIKNVVKCCYGNGCNKYLPNQYLENSSPRLSFFYSAIILIVFNLLS